MAVVLLRRLQKVWKIPTERKLTGWVEDAQQQAEIGLMPMDWLEDRPQQVETVLTQTILWEGMKRTKAVTRSTELVPLRTILKRGMMQVGILKTLPQDSTQQVGIVLTLKI